MTIRKSAGRRWRAVRSRAASILLVAATVVAVGDLSDGALAQPGAGVLDHHAVVLNGRIVGSAFPLDDDLVVTNAHVVEGLQPGASVTLVVPTGPAQAIAEVVAISPRMDLAVLRAPAGFLPAVAPADAPLVPGLPVIGAGVDASGGRGVGPRMELVGKIIQPNVDLGAFGPGLVVRMPGARPGFSGGPVLDGEGRLVGMITAIRSSGAAHSARGGARANRQRLLDEAFVLRADKIRREAARLLHLAGEE